MASLQRVDIGNFISSYPQLGLRAHSECYVLFSPGADIPDNGKVGLSATFLDVEDIWVGRGRGFCLAFHLHYENWGPDNEQQSLLVEALRVDLAHASVWKQLSLRAELAQPAPIEFCSDSTVIELSLEYDDLVPFQKGGTASVALPSLQRAFPPASISTRDLHKVQFNVYLESRPKRTQKKTRVEENILGIEKDMLLGTGCSDYSSEELLDEIVVPPQESQYSRGSSLLGPKSGSQASDESLSSHSQLEPSKNKSWREDSDAQKDELYVGLDIRGIVWVMNAVLITFLGPSRAVRVHGQQTKGNDIGTGLAKFAPGLFSPGYPYALAQRSRRISTISQSLVAFHRRMTSSVIRDQFEAIACPTGNQHLTTPTLRHTIEKKLWLIVQSDLYRPVQVKQLKALSMDEEEAQTTENTETAHTDETLSDSHLISPLELAKTQEEAKVHDVLDGEYMEVDEFDLHSEYSDFGEEELGFPDNAYDAYERGQQVRGQRFLEQQAYHCDSLEDATLVDEMILE